jgi:hypothetical protein
VEHIRLLPVTGITGSFKLGASMAKFAEKTKVSPEKSMAEIQATLKKYGASKFAFIEGENIVAIAFVMNKRNIRFKLPLPHAPKHMTIKAEKEHAQEIRQRWRALFLVIKAKLESVESAIETFDDAFMAHIVMPNNQTMSEWGAHQIEKSYSSGKMPPLLGYDN